MIYVLRRAKDAKERAKYRRDYNLFGGIFANYARLTAQKGTAISKESREKEVEWKQLSLADLEVRLGEVAQQVTKLVEQKQFAFDEKSPCLSCLCRSSTSSRRSTGTTTAG